MSDHSFQWAYAVAQTINAGASFTGPALAIDRIDHMESLVIKTTSATGDPDLRIQFALGHASVSNYPPLLSSDAAVDFESFAANPDILTSTQATFGLADNQTIHILDLKLFDIERAKYVKFKFTGAGGNPADTVLNAWVIALEKVRNVGP